jgi:mRNA interferase RelE/StbE
MAQYTISFKPSAVKQLERLPKSVQRRIVSAIEELADDPRPAGCVKLLGQENLWRIRVGSYRVVYSIDDDNLEVMILRIVHRKDVY